MKKLELVGCDHRVIKWFESYLTRMQVVSYNGIESSPSAVPTGIGQGTILGIVDNMFFVKIIYIYIYIYIYVCVCVCNEHDNQINVMLTKRTALINIFKDTVTNERCPLGLG